MSNDLTTKLRADKRIFSRESVSIQILLPCVEFPEAPRVVAGVTKDISASGLRIILNEPIAAERVFDLCIELDFNPRYFLLIGETRWCRRVDDKDDEYEIGIFIHDSEGTDYKAWNQLFDDL